MSPVPGRPWESHAHLSRAAASPPPVALRPPQSQLAPCPSCFTGPLQLIACLGFDAKMLIYEAAAFQPGDVSTTVFFFSLESKNLWEVRYCFYCFQMITCDPLQVWIKATLITQHSFNTAESTSSHKPYLCERQQVLLHTDYHWQTWLMVYEKRERPTDHFRYILIVGTSRDYFLGLVSNNKQKVLSTPQGTERCQAP